MCDELLQPREFLFGDIAVGAGLQSAERNVHDPDSLQRAHAVVERLAHAADLAVQALCEDDPEREFIDLLYGAGTGDRI